MRSRVEGSRLTRVEAMESEKNPDRPNVRFIKRPARPKRFVSRTRLIMGVLLIVAVPTLIGLANKAVRENGEAIL